jgi:hypothetical protein
MTGWMKRGLEPKVHPTIKDIYWAAGIYEGEGTCKHKPGTLVSVSQKDTWILLKLKELFGGTVSVHDKVKKSSHWQISGPRARGFLMTIYSLLSPHRQARIREVLNT